MRRAAVALALAVALAAGRAASQESSRWDWLAPMAPGERTGLLARDESHALAGSSLTHTTAELRDQTRAVDWFPNAHPAAPAPVMQGTDGAGACGFCHLPDGTGRPENASLAGLPADYIERQVAAFADGSRKTPLKLNVPVQMMAATARHVTGAQVHEAAAYFASLRFVPRVKVIEATQASFGLGRYVYTLGSGHEQPIGERIIEGPSDLDAFEKRDPRVPILAYVPPGSIAAGRALVASGGPAGLPCGSCHGEGLRGGIAPPLAGRSPTGLMRQLIAFKAGTRSSGEAAPMRAVAGPLADKDMIALAAYAGSLKP